MNHTLTLVLLSEHSHIMSLNPKATITQRQIILLNFHMGHHESMKIISKMFDYQKNKKINKIISKLFITWDTMNL